MIGGLDHINIETTDLDTSTRFYEQVLGMHSGWRPAFDVPGAWMYVDDHPIVHLVVRDSVHSAPTGAIHHVALKASGLDDMKKRLDEHGIAYAATVVPDLDVTQLFIDDPNGVKLELNFYADASE